MNIAFQYLSGAGGALSNVILLLRSYALKYPEDRLLIVCSQDSGLTSLKELPNIQFALFDIGTFKEVRRAWLGYFGLNRIAENFQADVVWSLNLGSYVRRRIPNVLSIHNPHQVYPSESTKSHPKSRLTVAMLQFFFRRSLRSADAVIVQTALMGEYARHAPNCPRQVAVIPKSVERSSEVSSECLSGDMERKLVRIPFRGTTWLYVATAIPHKNHRVLTEAALILKGASSSAHRIVLTISEEEAIARCGPRARELIDAGILVPVGWVAKKHLRALYEACDACVMPSILESLSSAHLEAMEWSRPQIVADLPYARDLCGDAALYVDPHNPGKWVAAMADLSASRELQASLVDKGRKRMELFPRTWDEAATSVRQVLTSVVK